MMKNGTHSGDELSGAALEARGAGVGGPAYRKRLFAPVAESLLDDPNLTTRERRVLLLLSVRAMGATAVAVSAEGLAEAAAMDMEDVRRLMVSLERKGYITVDLWGWGIISRLHTPRPWENDPQAAGVIDMAVYAGLPGLPGM